VVFSNNMTKKEGHCDDVDNNYDLINVETEGDI
jgi:hypothetical protein